MYNITLLGVGYSSLTVFNFWKLSDTWGIPECCFRESKNPCSYVICDFGDSEHYVVRVLAFLL